MFGGAAVLITGADSGIGRAIALVFARKCADVLAFYLDEHDDAQATSELVKQAGRRAALFPGDIGSESLSTHEARCVAKFGCIDVPVNNAAFQRTHELIEDLRR